MEIRVFRGAFVTGTGLSDEIDLQVILTVGGGVASGSGSFELPLALAGWPESEPMVFRTEAGDELTLVVREISVAEGRAYFLTRGAVPEARRARTG